MKFYAYIALSGLCLTGPIGKTLIKKSTEYSENNRRVLNLTGLFFMSILLPISCISSYAFADNAIVAPISASGALFNLLLARLFLEEGKHMNRYTILGIITFVSGMCLLVFTYTSFIGNDIDDEHIEWGILSLFLGIWMFSLTIITNVCTIFKNPRIQLIGWSISVGLLMGADIIASMDKWIYNHNREYSDETNKSIIASCFYIISCVLGIYILNKLLLDSYNPMHIVSSIVLSISLIMDVIADCVVFQRYELWDKNNYVMAIIGLILMIVGINVLQISKYEKQKKEENMDKNKTKAKLSRPLSIGHYYLRI